MSQPSVPPPQTIRRLEEAAVPLFALHAAIQLGVFTPLASRAMAADELADALGVDATKLSMLLYILAYIGLLSVEGGRFANGDEAAHYLVQGTPTYLRGLHTMWSSGDFAANLATADSIRTGIAQAKLEYTEANSKELEAFLRGRNTLLRTAGAVFAARYDLSSCRTLVDVGGGAGGLSIALAEAYPQLHITLVDLAHVTEIAREVVAESGFENRIETQDVDLLRESPPGMYDAAVLFAFLQIFPVAEIRIALRNVAATIRPGGTIYILGQILDDTRLTPANAVMMNLGFLNIYDHGQSYTDGEYQQWLTEAGFINIRRDAPLGQVTICIADKAG
jgi:predicted O-methyltransferase YrrM